MKLPRIADVIKYAQLTVDLRHFVRNTISLERSKQVIRERLRNRENNFLSLLNGAVYNNPRSPYRKLLKEAGCEYGDIDSLVRRDGIEETLSELLKKGVYISWEEFKGKKQVTRNQHSFHFDESDFDNPNLPGYYHVRSSGTRSSGTKTIFDFNHQLDKSYYHLPVLEANGSLDCPLGLWLPRLPSMAGIGSILNNCKLGKPVARWFSPTDESHIRSTLRDRLATLYIVYGGRLWGAKLAKPEYVSLNNAIVVAKWMAETKQQLGGCALQSYVSPAVNVCQAALRNGLDITGTTFFVAGEPLTEAKRGHIEATGASVVPMYYISEAGFIGCGCKSGHGVDDIHLFHDSVAVIRRRRRVEHSDIYVNAFLYTSLLSAAPKIMINVESDDYGELEIDDCSCTLGELGFNRHMHHIRSFAKLTSGGMTIVGTDFLRIIEEVLPSKYGGAPTDYQLVEEEDSSSHTRLYLYINPSIGDLDNDDVVETVLGEIGKSGRAGKLAEALWAQVNTLQIRRIAPVSSSSKITSLHLIKKQ
jgi:hypothetical protein